MLVIETENLRKEFGPRVAVQGLTLQVQAGEVFGFLGPNGAGKTTFIKMMLGLVRPTSGQARMLGLPAGSTTARARTGFLPEHFRFHDWLTAEEFLTLHGQLYGLPGAELKQRSAELLERVGLEDFRRQQLRTFSKGMLQRIGLAQALLNHPELVFLDEPTSGLDPVGRRLVRDVIHELRSSGATVFLNSHLLSEVEITCDRVAFIKHGEVLRTSSLQSLSAEAGASLGIEGEISVAIRAGGLTADVVSGLERFGRDVRADGERLTLTVGDDAVLPEIARYLVGAGVELYALTPQRISLEDLFIQVVGTDGGL
jgi:ABC-2 type transport system ATP-binding protein